ncbi:MAG: ester cyclase [Chloroflexi bacterium]|nr:ester cyclase [Chloroflexota bacterium]MBV9595883.1 ester cyclase [Chloroflexota bacterium]
MGASRQVAEQLYAAIAAHDQRALSEMCAPTCEMIEPGVHLKGGEQIGTYMQAFFTAFPDLRIAVESMLEVDNAVATEVRFIGTHTGPLAGPSGELPATRKAVDLAGADFLTVSNGKLTSWHVYYDTGAFMSQLGLSPGPSEVAPA